MVSWRAEYAVVKKCPAALGICLRNGLARLRLQASEAPCDDSQGQAIPVPDDREMDVQILLAELHNQLPEFTSFLIFTASQFSKPWKKWKIKWQLQT